MLKPRLNVLIVGAGLGGLSAAIAIKLAGHEVLVLEKASTLSEVGAGIQIPPNSARFLISWGLREAIDRVSVLPEAIRLRSYRDGSILNEQPLVPLSEEDYGGPYWQCHRADFHKALVDKCYALGVKIRINSMVTKIDFEAPSVTLSTGSTIGADLIVGADGLKSNCREQFLGRSDPPHLTGDLAYRILIKVDEMRKHKDLDTHRPARPRSLLPLERRGLLQHRLNLPRQHARGGQRYVRRSRRGPRVFQILGPKTAEDDHLAQGAAIAVEDGGVLGGLLGKLEDRSQLPGLLRVYEDLRKSRTTRIVTGSTDMRSILHLGDGERQKRRDATLLADDVRPGFPNKWRDPAFRNFMFGYDGAREVEVAWERFRSKGGSGAAGAFRARL